MSEVVGWAVTAAGALVVVATIVDAGRTLWNPSADGRVSHLVMAGAWRVGRLGRAVPRPMTGPVGVVGVITTWTASLVLGWALVYLPHLPQAFSYSPGLDPASRSAALDSVYVSTVVLATLGLGDVVPQVGWLRAALPLQALTGFALLTASVSWVLQLYPALGRRRALAADVHALGRTTAPEQLVSLGSSHPAGVLDRLGAAVAQVRVDLDQYGETFYFTDADERSSLPAAAPVLARLAEAGKGSGRDDVRVAAAALDAVLDDLADVLRPRLGLGAGPSTREVLDRYAQAHGS
ncbi:potassium channel family protein [Thalassiella azotivora]